MLDGLFGGSYPQALKASLEAMRLSHDEVSHNLANLETPGYSARQTDFKELLLQKRPDGAPAHGAPFQAFLQEAGQRRQGVNVERELARLSQTSMEQSASVQFLTGEYHELLQALTEGKKG